MKPFFLFLTLSILTLKIGFCQKNTEYKKTEKELTDCELARMISNRMNLNRDWETIIDASLNEFIQIIEGTNQYKYLGKLKIETFKKSLKTTFPDYYKNLLTNSFCLTIQNKQLLKIIYNNVSGFHLTNSEIEFLELNFSNEVEDLLFTKMRELRTSSIKEYSQKLVIEYERLLNSN